MLHFHILPVARALSAAALLAVTMSVPATAGDKEVCEGNVPADAVAACTRLLAGKKVSREDRAQFLIFRSVAHESLGDVPSAMADVEKAMTIKPDWALAHLNRGVHRGNTGDSAGAVADYTRAIALDPNYALAYLYRARQNSTAGKTDAALADFDKAVELDAQSAENYRSRGDFLSDQRRYDEAIKDFDRAIDLDASVAASYLSLGFAQEMKGDRAAARESYTKGLSIDPNSAWGLGNRGNLYATIGEYDLAVADLNRAIEIQADNPDFYVNRGYALTHKTRLDEALNDFKKASELVAGNTRALINIATIYDMKGEPDRAKLAFQTLIGIEPTTADGYGDRGDARLRLDDKEGAKRDYEKAAQLAPHSEWPEVGLARVAFESGDLAGAVASFTRAIEKGPYSATPYNGRAWALYKLGRLAQAKADIDKAISLDGAAAYRDTRGHILTAMGDVDAALKDFDRAIQLGHNAPSGWWGRGNAYERLAQTEKAKADYLKALAAPANDTDQREARASAEKALAIIMGSAPVVTPPPASHTVAIAPRPVAPSSNDSNPPGKRVALVIGVGNYQSWSRLNNPVRDAKAVSDMLKKYGFTVIERTGDAEVSFLGLHDAISDLERESQGADMAFVYYAGHGMQVGDKNVLAPADMPDLCEEPHTKRAIDLDSIFRAVKSARAKVVLLDACRNNPFPRCPKKADQSGSGFRALGRVEGTGLLIANATSPGGLADDGISGEGSPFARALVSRMSTSPHQDLRDLLANVAADVETQTQSVQTPEVTLRGNVSRMCLAGTGCGSGN